MTRRVKVLGGIAALVVLAIGFFAYHMFGPPPSDLDLARTRVTGNGLYTVAIAPEVEPFQREVLHSWIVTVTDKDGKPVEGAAIAIDGGMPRHGHGLPTAPQMTAELGAGKYRVEGVKFHMMGWWEFKLAITAPAGADAVTFNLAL